MKNMKKNSIFNLNTFLVFGVYSVLIIVIVFVVEKQSALYKRIILIPGLAPVLVPLIASFLVFPAILLTNMISANTILYFKNHFINRYFQKYSTLFILLFSSIMVLGIFGRVLTAKWGVIDDHEIVAFLGQDGRLYLSEILPSLKSTEIGDFGSLTRYRPSYYLLRLLECFIWGANPALWYAFRLVILILSVSLFWNFIAHRLGWLSGGMLCAYMLTFFYWEDIIGRLGPGESYAVLGLPIYIWGLLNAFKPYSTNLRYVLSGLAILLGTVVCVGSKENFVLLIISSIYVVIKAFKLKKYFLFLFALGSFLFSLYISIAVMILLANSGIDVYANTTAPLERFSIVLHSLFDIRILFPLAILGSLMVVLGILLLVRKFSIYIRKTLFQALFWFMVIWAVYFSQLIFYNGVWPTGTRYDFPGMLYIPAAIFILYLVAEKIAIEKPRLKYPKFIVRFGWIIALALFVLLRGYAPTIDALEKNVRVTKDFTNHIEQLSSILRLNPESALVLESGNILDYEPIFSYERFLRAYGVQNPLFLRIHGYSPEVVASGLDQSLALKLLDISNQGNNLFQPLSKIKNYQNRCYSLSLSGSFKSECQPIP